MKVSFTRKRVVAVLLVLVVLLVSAGLLYMFKLRAAVLIPGSLRESVPFSAVYPTSKSGVAVNAESAQYFSSEQLVVFEGEHQDARSRLVFSQQSLPDELNDSDGFKRMIDSMAPYGNFNSKFGQVHLTRPPSQGERQSAVLKTENSLVFILAAENLTEEQWRVLVNSLVLEKK